jgi:hypothetical protein
VGADAEASGPGSRVDRRAAARRRRLRRGVACARERVLGRIKFGVPLFECVELQKFE